MPLGKAWLNPAPVVLTAWSAAIRKPSACYSRYTRSWNSCAMRKLRKRLWRNALGSLETWLLPDVLLQVQAGSQTVDTNYWLVGWWFD